MRKVVLTLKEQQKYDVIKKLVETEGNKKRAANKLKLTPRQINRLIVGYKQFGKEFFIHGNRGRKPANSLSDDLKNQIEDLYNTKYFDCTYTQFTEFLADRENIYLSIAEVGQMHILDSPDAYISAKKFKWMLLFIYGLVMKKLLYMLLLMTLLGKFLQHTSIAKKH